MAILGMLGTVPCVKPSHTSQHLLSDRPAALASKRGREGLRGCRHGWDTALGAVAQLFPPLSLLLHEL